MNELFSLCPQPPNWNPDWQAIHERFPWIQRMVGVMQDEINHGEGDVWIHVRLVCEALISSESWRALPEPERHILFAAVLLHDVAKPECRREEPDGHISFRGHSRRGAVLARQILWRLQVPFAMREQICNLVRYHQIPFFYIERNDQQSLALEMSQSVRCRHLATLAEADAVGRICQDRNRLLENTALFAESCREMSCLDKPYVFPSDHTRFVYFRQPGRFSDAEVHDDSRCDVVLMSGLPASGKDTWVKENLADWPCVSLDDLREELDIDPGKAQGEIIHAARDRAKELLRSGTAFVWNATNLSRQIRGMVLKLLTDYKARIRIVYIETDEDTLRQRNHDRSRSVPTAVIDKCLDKWEVPDLTEAHAVQWVVSHS